MMYWVYGLLTMFNGPTLFHFCYFNNRIVVTGTFIEQIFLRYMENRLYILRCIQETQELRINIRID